MKSMAPEQTTSLEKSKAIHCDVGDGARDGNTEIHTTLFAITVQILFTACQLELRQRTGNWVGILVIGSFMQDIR